MPRLRRLLVSAIAGWVFTASVVHATSTRIQSLGGDGDYFEDDFNVLRWCGSLPGYGDLAVLELGNIFLNSTAQSEVFHQGAGIHAHLDRAQRWGTTALYVSDVADPYQLPATISLMWSHYLGPVQAGISYQWARVDDTSDPTEGAITRQETNATLGLGLRFDLADRAYLDLAGDWIGTARAYERRLGPDAFPYVEQEGMWQSYAFRGRAFWGVTETVALVPLVDHWHHEHLDLSVRESAVPTELDARQTRLGLGCNVFPDSDNMLVMSYEYRFGAGTRAALPNSNDLTRSESEAHSHHLRLGIESRLTSWLTLRGGAQQVLPEVEVTAFAAGDAEAGEIVGRSEEPQLDLNLGLGLHFGAFDADFVFNEDAPFALGQILIGTGDQRDSNFTSITLRYGF